MGSDLHKKAEAVQNVDSRKKVVALGYNPEKDAAPLVLAKGKGLFAEKILEVARQNGIAITEEKELVDNLFSIETSCAIPPELYEAVAQVLAFVYQRQQSVLKKLAPG